MTTEKKVLGGKSSWLLLQMLLNTPLFDEDNEDNIGGGLEEMAKDLGIHYKHEIEQENLAHLIYDYLMEKINV